MAHIVYQFQEGDSPEAIRSHYPTLTLAQVYGAITFYLGNCEEVQADLMDREREEDTLRKHIRHPLQSSSHSSPCGGRF